MFVSLLLSLQVFLAVGESFTAELTDVRLVSPILGSPPRLLHEASVATVTVPEEAASSEVSSGCGFLFVDVRCICGGEILFVTAPSAGHRGNRSVLLSLVWSQSSIKDISYGVCVFL